jgi:uncharacterized protein (DUF952 family)
MPHIYHLVTPAAWGQAGDEYQADSLEGEGFIHCSFADQVARSANRFYAGAPELLLLHIDRGRLARPLRTEAAGTGELFPHVYGPINREAVVAVESLKRGPDGQWLWESESRL